MSNPTMLYRVGDSHKLDGHFFDYIIRDSEDASFREALEAGWHLTPEKALAYEDGKLEPEPEAKKVEPTKNPSVKVKSARV